MSKKRKVTIEMSEEQYLTLKKWAEERDNTMPEFVEGIIKKQIVEHEASDKALNVLMREIQGWKPYYPYYNRRGYGGGKQ